MKCVLTVWRTAADSIGFFYPKPCSTDGRRWWQSTRFGIKKADGWRGLWSVSTWGPGPSLGLQFQGLIVSRYKVTTGVGGRNGKKHSGNSVWLPEVSYSTVNETSLKVYGCVWEYPQLERFIIILPMTMAVWGCISPSSETAKQDFHLWYPKNKKHIGI